MYHWKDQVEANKRAQLPAKIWICRFSHAPPPQPTNFLIKTTKFAFPSRCCVLAWISFCFVCVVLLYKDEGTDNLDVVGTSAKRAKKTTDIPQVGKVFVQQLLFLIPSFFFILTCCISFARADCYSQCHGVCKTHKNRSAFESSAQKTCFQRYAKSFPGRWLAHVFGERTFVLDQTLHRFSNLEVAPGQIPSLLFQA